MRLRASDGSTAAIATAGSCGNSLAVDATSLYWIAETDSYTLKVMKVPLRGGDPTTIAEEQGGSGGITVDDTSVYWTTSLGAKAGVGAVMKLTPK
ncbi:MAG TPA: hypothetical protein VHC69_09275 [Polyangiaceae bacterium]|nr:hypothetical protein [Polyangiaceae bacterium]